MSLSLISKFLEGACHRKLGSWEPGSSEILQSRVAYQENVGLWKRGWIDDFLGSVKLSHLVNRKCSNIAPDIAKHSTK